jgi:hypothetical protein
MIMLIIMVDKMILNFYPVLAFIAGAALKSWSMINNYSFSVMEFGFFLIFSMSILMLIFTLLYPK